MIYPRWKIEIASDKELNVGEFLGWLFMYGYLFIMPLAIAKIIPDRPKKGHLFVILRGVSKW